MVVNIRTVQALIVATVLLSPAALAHTKLASSAPAEGAAVSAPVEAIALIFEDAVRLTAVALTDAAGAQRSLGDVPTEIAADLVVEVRERLAPGDYVIVWRAVGADTHVVSGEIRFSVAAAHAR